MRALEEHFNDFNSRLDELSRHVRTAVQTVAHWSDQASGLADEAGNVVLIDGVGGGGAEGAVDGRRGDGGFEDSVTVAAVAAPGGVGVSAMPTGVESLKSGAGMSYEANYDNGAAGFAAGVVTGAIVGAGVALLLAPRSGAELREEVGESWKTLRDAVGRRYREIADRAGVELDNIQEKSTWPRAPSNRVRARSWKRQPTRAAQADHGVRAETKRRRLKFEGGWRSHVGTRSSCCSSCCGCWAW